MTVEEDRSTPTQRCNDVRMYKVVGKTEGSDHLLGWIEEEIPWNIDLDKRQVALTSHKNAQKLQI